VIRYFIWFNNRGNFYSTVEKKKQEFVIDDFVHLVGIFLHELFCDRLDVIQDNCKERAVLDDKSNMSKKACFEEAAKCFRDKSITVRHPNNWDVCCMKHGDPGIEPNNLE